MTLHDEVRAQLRIPSRLPAAGCSKGCCSAIARSHPPPNSWKLPALPWIYTIRSRLRTWTGARSCRPSRTSAPAETCSRSRSTSWRQVRCSVRMCECVCFCQVCIIPCAGSPCSCCKCCASSCSSAAASRLPRRVHPVPVAGEEIAKCPSCSLYVRVIYDPQDFQQPAGVEA